MKYGIHEDTPISYESMGRMLQEKISPLHGYGKVQASDVRGRIEMPIWDRENGYKLKEKGRVSIGIGKDAEGKLTASDARLLKELVLNGFGANLREQDFDFFLYTADTELRSNFGVSTKDRFGIKFQPTEGERLKQAAEKAFGMSIIEDATIAGLSSQKGYKGQFKSKSLLRGTYDSYRQLLDQSDARIDKYGWKMQDGQKVFDRKQYERERSNYEEKRNKFLKYLQENGGAENVSILDVVKGNLKEHGIDKDTNWMTPSHKGGILTVDELFTKYEAEFNRELEENKRYRKQYEEAKAELDDAPLDKVFQTGKPVAVKAFHGSPYGEIKGNTFAPEMLGKYTKAASAKNAYFFAGSERTSRAYIQGGETMSFDAKVPYDGWIGL